MYIFKMKIVIYTIHLQNEDSYISYTSSKEANVQNTRLDYWTQELSNRVFINEKWKDLDDSNTSKGNRVYICHKIANIIGGKFSLPENVQLWTWQALCSTESHKSFFLYLLASIPIIKNTINHSKKYANLKVKIWNQVWSNKYLMKLFSVTKEALEVFIV